METLFSLFLLAIGIVLLYFGGEWLVRNSVILARSWGVSAMVVGLTVVAFGTSSPELAASLSAALMGSPAIAIGNVVGSNIFNILVILGLTAVIAPIAVQSGFIKREVPFMIGVALLLFPILYFGNDVNRLEGLLLFSLLIGYVVFLFRFGQSESAAVEAEYDEEFGDGSRPKAGWRAYFGVVVGLVLLGVGARLLVMGAVDLARGFGVSELVIGLTIVAAGTSLPEVAASIVAAIRRHPDIALGNIVGSNIFNILSILGIVALVHPIGLPWESIQRDMLVMLAASLILWPFLTTGSRLGRSEGGFFLLAYIAYVAYLIISA
jgi:cation:H+ antiporter